MGRCDKVHVCSAGSEGGPGQGSGDAAVSGGVLSSLVSKMRCLLTPSLDFVGPFLEPWKVLRMWQVPSRFPRHCKWQP